MEDNPRFKINDVVIYGSSGVCLVKDICALDIDNVDNTKQYYVLEPLYSEGSIIYSPVDNGRTVMRKILTKAEAQELITRIPSIETFWVDDRKMREERCKQALSTYNCYEIVRIIKTLYLRKEALVQQKKPASQIDERYLRTAEDLLYGELAIPLEIPKEQVQGYIMEQVEKMLNLA
ncbi:MAG TPA: CarD family transcriptional regulator [Bacillota bacterium]|nr:CarD family transcriptional regulator [Bacillota bacterium]